MAGVFESIINDLASGKEGYPRAEAVISLEGKGIVWDGRQRRRSSVAIYSKNGVELIGRAVSLHPQLKLEPTEFVGNSTFTFELEPPAVPFRDHFVMDGILICYNGGEIVIPIETEVSKPGTYAYAAVPVAAGKPGEAVPAAAPASAQANASQDDDIPTAAMYRDKSGCIVIDDYVLSNHNDTGHDTYDDTYQDTYDDVESSEIDVDSVDNTESAGSAGYSDISDSTDSAESRVYTDISDSDSSNLVGSASDSASAASGSASASGLSGLASSAAYSVAVNERRNLTALTRLVLEDLSIFRGHIPEDLDQAEERLDEGQRARHYEILQSCTEITSRLVTLQPERLRYRLYQAIAYALNGNTDYAGKIESRFRAKILGIKNRRQDDYCVLLYLQYLLSLYDNSLHAPKVYIKQLTAILSLAMGRFPQDHDMVLLLCSDALGQMEENPVSLLKELHFAYERGNNSPYLYYFGALLYARLKENPDQEGRMDQFAVRCLARGVREGIVSKEIALRACSYNPDQYSPCYYHTLEHLYRLYPDNEILKTLCMALIKNDVRSTKAFLYYERAVFENLNLARLYDYYILSMPSGGRNRIHRKVMLAYRNEDYMSPRIRTRLCLNTLNYYVDDEEIFNIYRPGMVSHLREQIANGSFNEDVAMLASQLLTPDMLDQKTAETIIPMLDVSMVSSDVPDGFELLYENDMFAEPARAIFQDGSCYIRLDGDNGKFHVLDSQGRRTGGMRLQVNPLVEDEALVAACRRLCPDHPMLQLRSVYDAMMDQSYVGLRYDLCMKYLQDKRLSYGFRQKILKYIVAYMPSDQDLVSWLPVIRSHAYMMSGADIISFAETLAARGYYKDAGDILAAVRWDTCSKEVLVNIALAMIRHPGVETDLDLGDLLEYLVAGGYGTDAMYCYLAEEVPAKKSFMKRVYEECLEHQIVCDPLKRALLRRMLEEGDDDTDRIRSLLLTTDMNQEDPRQDQLLLAGLAWICHMYLCGRTRLDNQVISMIQGHIMFDGNPDAMPLQCRLSCLRYDYEFGMQHDIEHMMILKLCSGMIRDQKVFDFLSWEAGKNGIRILPALTANLSEYGPFHEDLSGLVEEGKAGIYAEFYSDLDPDRHYRVPLYKAYGPLYSSYIAAFAGEVIHYRFICREQMTDWFTFEGWVYETHDAGDQVDFAGKDDISLRYESLQKIAASCNINRPNIDEMKEYERYQKLINQFGRF